MSCLARVRVNCAIEQEAHGWPGQKLHSDSDNTPAWLRRGGDDKSQHSVPEPVLDVANAGTAARFLTALCCVAPIQAGVALNPVLPIICVASPAASPIPERSFSVFVCLLRSVSGADRQQAHEAAPDRFVVLEALP